MLNQIIGLLRLALISLVAFTGSTAFADWHMARTTNFTIYADYSAEDLKRYALQLESFDRLLRLRFGITNSEPQYPLTIYLVLKASEVDALAGAARASGFYRAGRYGSFAVANTEERSELARQSREDSLLHEYTHHFFFRHVQVQRPAWYVEGFAQYFATARLSDAGEWTVGGVAGNRAYTLLQGVRLPIRTLLTAKPHELERGETAAFYARSWLFVHMLYADPRRQAQLQGYLTALGRGEQPLVAAEANFGDLDALDRALNAYLKSSLQAVTYDPIGTYQGPLIITKLSPAEAALVRPTLRRRSGYRLEDVQTDLAVLAERYPDSSAIWFETALVRFDLANRAPSAQIPTLYAEAESAVDRALAIDPAHGRANLFKAELRMRALVRDKDTDAAKWREVRAFIYKANQADPNDPAPLFAWYDTYARQGKPPSDTARAGLARAFSLQPEVPDIRAKYAFDLARGGEFDKAIALIEILGGDPHRAKQASEMLDRLRAMRDHGVTPGGVQED